MEVHMKRLTPVLGATMLAFGLASVTFAQGESDLRQEIEDLKQGQQQIQKQLQEIQQLLKTRPAAAPARPAGPDVKGKIFDLADNPVKGESTAKLTLVDFTDYQ
jgi:hypothetical protein